MDKDEILESVKFLAALDKDSAQRYNLALGEVIALLGRYSLRFKGKYTELNPLLGIYESDPDLFESVLGIVRKRRADNVFAGRSRRYMADFMREKRARERRAIELENMTRPDNQKLRGVARMNFAKKVSAEWNERRLKMLAAARDQYGDRIPKEKLQELLDLFWKQIDDEMDKMENELR